MGTKIEWCDETINPIKMRCTPVSEGCQNCYAQRLLSRNLPGFASYPKNGQPVFDERALQQPERWKKPRKIFVESMGDMFHHTIQIGWLNDIFAMIRSCHQHTFMILTKRPDTALGYSREIPRLGLTWPDNAWLGVTAENQRTADERIPILLQIPAAVRFVSVEPMLGPVDIAGYLGEPYWWCEKCDREVASNFVTYNETHGTECGGDVYPQGGVDWVICGAETGPKARPMNPEWAMDSMKQCQSAGIPFFFKKFSNQSKGTVPGMPREFPKV